jgi:hypothetical protein
MSNNKRPRNVFIQWMDGERIAVADGRRVSAGGLNSARSDKFAQDRQRQPGGSALSERRWARAAGLRIVRVSVTIAERGVQMTKATLRKIIVVLLSAAVLSGGLGADAAYALGGGGFGAGHMGGSHVGSVADGGIGGLGSGKMVAGFGRGHLGMAGGFSREHAGGLGAAL